MKERFSGRSALVIGAGGSTGRSARAGGPTLARRSYGDLFVDHYALSRRAEQHGWERARGAAVAPDDGQVGDGEACRYLEVL
jgi:hypothetical protein